MHNTQICFDKLSFSFHDIIAKQQEYLEKGYCEDGEI
jgi:hypothetical protein